MSKEEKMITTNCENCNKEIVIPGQQEEYCYDCFIELGYEVEYE